MNENPQTVPGERGVSSVDQTPSAQSRVTRALVVMFFGALTLAGLAWYYSSLLSRAHRPQAQATKAVQQRAEGEMSLPALALPAPQPPEPASQVIVQDHRHTGVARQTERSEQTTLQRQLSGPAIVRVTSGASNRSAAVSVISDRAGVFEGGATPAGGSELTAFLHSTSTPSARAHRLASQRLLLAKGTTLDCTLLSAIDSTLPGFTKCVTATDTWSADGSVVLLNRGSQLFGETRGQVEAGKSRLFIVWSEARTPDGIVVPLASPGTDPLGRAGVSGQIDRHFWSRFGSAILISVIDGVVQGVANSQSRGSVVVNPSGSRDVLTEVLRETIQVRPTLRKHQGDRVAVLVARDVDFRGVYARAAE